MIKKLTYVLLFGGGVIIGYVMNEATGTNPRGGYWMTLAVGVASAVFPCVAFPKFSEEAKNYGASLVGSYIAGLWGTFVILQLFHALL